MILLKLAIVGIEPDDIFDIFVYRNPFSLNDVVKQCAWTLSYYRSVFHIHMGTRLRGSSPEGFISLIRSIQSIIIVSYFGPADIANPAIRPYERLWKGYECDGEQDNS